MTVTWVEQFNGFRNWKVASSINTKRLAGIRAS